MTTDSNELTQAAPAPAVYEPGQLDGLGKIAAANAIAQTLAYSLERKYLQGSGGEGEALCTLKAVGAPDHRLTGYHWLKVTQVGKFSADTKQNCFDAMQTILHSCNLPETSLAFLILGDKGVFSLYMGLSERAKSRTGMAMSKIGALQDFASSNWKGLVTKKADTDAGLRDFFSSPTYTKCHALTGIPTLNATDRYARSVDQIIGGGKNREHIAYLVTAKPVAEEKVDAILRECREMQSQAESFRGFSISESLQKSESNSDAHTVSETVTETISGQINEEKGNGARNAIFAVTGLAVAAAIFYPPALSVVPAVANKIKTIPKLKSTMAILNLGSQAQSLAMAKGFIPRKSAPKKKDRSEATSTTDTTTHGFTESYSRTVSQTISNAHIEAAVEHLKTHAERYRLGKATGMWEVGCYVLTDNEDGGMLASQVRAVLSGKESVYEPLRVHDISELVSDPSGFVKGFKEELQVYAGYIPENGFADEPFRHPFGQDFARLTTILTTRELSCLMNMPMNSVPGISVVDIWPDFSLTPQKDAGTDGNALPLGKLIFERQETAMPVGVNLDTFSRHSLVAGVNGSGKTNSVLSVLEGFLAKGRPVMVFEPAKTEYVDWAIKYNAEAEEYNRTVADKSQKRKKIRIFIPGCNYYAKGRAELTDVLRINPFEVIPSKNGKNGYRVVSHLDKLKSVLAGAFPMQDILPTVIERLLYKLYTDSGWLDGDTAVKTRPFPTLADINKKFISELMAQLGYAEENTMNISAALRTRFNSMKQGWKGEMLDNETMTGLSWAELFGEPCVINLSYVGDDSDKAFIMSLLMQYLYEYRIAESEAADYSFNDNECRHLTVIEEAHRVMSRCESPELPQYRSNQMFASILSEVRAYGEGIMVVDQVPSRLIEDAVKNTNIKIIHKIVAADDTRLLAESAGMSDEQQAVIPRLSIGQAILVGLNSLNAGAQNAGDIYLAKINKKK